MEPTVAGEGLPTHLIKTYLLRDTSVRGMCHSFYFTTLYNYSTSLILFFWYFFKNKNLIPCFFSHQRERISMSEVGSHGKTLPSADREQLRLELQQLNHQISQQTQLRGLEVPAYRYLFYYSF